MQPAHIPPTAGQTSEQQTHADEPADGNRANDTIQRNAIGGSPPHDTWLQISVAACVVVTVGSFFAVQPLIDLARHAANGIPF